MEEYISEGDYNYSLILSDMIEPDKISNSYIDNFLERRVDGIATTTDNLSVDYLKLLRNVNVPIIFVNRYLENTTVRINYVSIDNFKGAYMITEHLIKLGHINIAHISSDIKYTVVANRLTGFKTAMNDYGIEVKDENIIIKNDLTAESGFMIASQLLTRKNPPSAIFCINDYTAYGVIDYCFKNNIRVPKDVSIAGFDDASFSSLGFVSLTTIRQPIKEIGRMAAEILLDKIKFGERDKVHKIFDPELVIRESTAFNKKA
ncbi:MAG: LacI family transcriptional regulator [Actinobacteria bacterium]|nr:LacI family transcriptional regulator [Actinomycetota bacterium]